MDKFYSLIIVLGLIIGGALFFYALRKKLKKFEVYGPIALYQTKRGVGFINWLSNLSKRFWKFYFTIGIITGFFFMADILITLFLNSLYIARTPTANEGVMLAIPGVTIPFLAPLIAIIILVFVHEFSHGITARVEGVKVESVGVVLLGFLPIGAFVKPNEKKVQKLKPVKKLRIFAAGAFSNIVFALLLLLFVSFVFIPAFTKPVNGVVITSVENRMPAEYAGLKGGMVITAINGKNVSGQISFINEINSLNLSPGDKLNLTIGDKVINVGTKNVSGRAYMGIGFCGQISGNTLTRLFVALGPVIFMKYNLINPKCYPLKFGNPLLFWFTFEILKWSIVLNYAVGLINLLPLKPLDGGLMVEAAIERFTRKKKLIKYSVLAISLFSLGILLMNFFGPAVWKFIATLG